ncbi:CGGC domain-containing protein [Chloroflexota bacterium]
MRVGIIRCEEHSNQCAGYHCLPAIQNRTGQFEGYDTIELVGFDSCGGCGRNNADKILARALRLKEKGAEVIHLGNCLVNACPFKNIYEKAMEEEVGLPIIERTHPSNHPSH